MTFIHRMLAAAALISGILTTSTALAAEAPEAAAPLTGDAICTKCHDKNEEKPVLSIYATRHGVKADARTPSCQSCHGDSDAHVKNTADTDPRPMPDVLFGSKRGSSRAFAPSEPKVQNASCLSCHSKDSKRTHWDSGAHNVGDVACTSCHETHAKQDKVRDKKTQGEVCFACHKEQRAQSRKISHHPIGEGKVACSDCHNPHGSAGPKLLKKNTVVETCYTCHAEKRGPFLWEHQPAAEDCITCHTPHGSNITPLLKSRTPFLCQECHDGPHFSRTPFAGDVAGVQGGLSTVGGGIRPTAENFTGRACMNCHVMVHGSNHPAGALLHR